MDEQNKREGMEKPLLRNEYATLPVSSGTGDARCSTIEDEDVFHPQHSGTWISEATYLASLFCPNLRTGIIKPGLLFHRKKEVNCYI